MQNTKFFISILIILFVFISCDNKLDDGLPDPHNVNGLVQKGPYINGTDITIAELNNDLSSTGKIFSTQIVDNKGTFESGNIALESPFVELKANGFYFNEVTNANSIAQLTLYALSDISETSNININVLSYLEKGRIQFLVTNGMDFTEAKQKAQSEILSIFEINQEGISDSERLDISKAGDANAALLAVSVILQGYLPVSELAELLANISTDIREDGILNSEELGTILINNARTIKLNEIRQNLESRYQVLGQSVSIPAFEQHIDNFIANTEFEFSAFIQYPPTGKHGLNILDREITEYTTGTYSMKAILPAGSSLKVRIGGSLNWMFKAFQEDTGWNAGDSEANYSRTFTATRTGEIDFQIKFDNYGEEEPVNMFVEVYENGETSPTWSKQIVLN